MEPDRNKTYDFFFLYCGFVFQHPTACSVCKRSVWCLYVIIKDVFCLSFVVEVCFVFSVLATYPVSVSNQKEWPEGRTAGGEDSERGEERGGGGSGRV